VADPDLVELRERLLRYCHVLGAEDLAAFEALVSDVAQSLNFRYGATAQLCPGDIVQVQVIGPEESSVRGMLGTVVDPAEYGDDVGNEPDAGGVPVVFTYADPEKGPLRLTGRVARPRLRRVGHTDLVPSDGDSPEPSERVYIPDRNEIAAAAAQRGSHG
jgi:hypothetical protein